MKTADRSVFQYHFSMEASQCHLFDTLICQKYTKLQYILLDYYLYFTRRYNSHYEKRGKTERCIDDEIPFEIPESWAWVRLGEICNFGDCKNIEADKIGSDSWLLDLEDIEKDSGVLLQKKRKSDVCSLSRKHCFYKGQVLYSKLRPYLNKSNNC